MTITIGLMADPGLPMQLTKALTHQPRGTDGEDWEFTTAREKLPMDQNGEIPLSRFAQELRERHGWDYAIYITELPLWRDGKPVQFEIIHSQRAALVSLPSLGIFRLRKRLHTLLDGVARAMLHGEVQQEFSTVLRHPLQHGSHESHGDDYVVIGGQLGRLQLVAGMVRSNRPGRLIQAMSNSIATAIATGTFGVFYASIWNLANALHPWRLVGISALVIAALSAWLIAHNGLWNTAAHVSDPGRRRRDNAATAATIGISVTLIHALLFIALSISSVIIIDSKFLASELGEPVSASNYLQLSLLATSLGMMAGAVGSNFDREEAIW
ncbi:MAG TPA: hypothetical protein VK054_02910, partial [Beutenbergiaceae bacterium]|nr:hypothetical protein [Beutenbergiaceae bacterium]